MWQRSDSRTGDCGSNILMGPPPPPRNLKLAQLGLTSLLYSFHSILFFKDFIYLFMRDTEREAGTQAEGETGSMQGAQCGTRSWVSRITPWAEGGVNPLSHLGCPLLIIFY